ncbi:MAG: hypothetical protein JXB23_09775 [Candidatus Aminicenantes bacterium]|nr:hypothetical protein [Candidatus Aminicenantes bacterium]
MNSESQTPPKAQDPMWQVSGPSTGLLIVGIIGGIISLGSFFSISIGTGFSTLWWKGFPDRYEDLWEGAFGIGSSLVGIIIAAFVIYAALKMKELSQWNLAVVASVLALIPCVSPCCIVGLPIGIWSLIVLTKPEVRSAFH